MRHILIFTLFLLSTRVFSQTVPTVWGNTLVPVKSANRDSSGFATLSQLFSSYGSGLSWNVGGNTVAAHSILGTNSNYDLIFRTNSTEKMRITSGGDIQLGFLDGGTKILYPRVKSYTLPAQGTRMAFINVSQYNTTKVFLTSSENNYHENIELLITRFWNQNPSEQPIIRRINTYLHAHSHDIGFTADSLGNIYAEKVLYNTGRVLKINSVEQYYGTCTFLDGSLTNTGIGADNSIYFSNYIYQSGSNGYLNNAVTGITNFGINTTTPSNTLAIGGTLRVQTTASGTQNDSIPTLSATGVLNRRTVADVTGWITSGNNQYSARSGNVGIGVAVPSLKLEVNGTTKTTNLQITSGATNTYVLQSDASGNGTWVSPASVLSNASGFVNGGNSFGATAVLGTNDNYSLYLRTNSGTKAVLSNTGNFGIGVISPQNKLDIYAGSEGNPIRAVGFQASASSADSILVYDPATGIFKRKGASVMVAAALPVAAVDQIGNIVMYITATDTTQLVYLGGNKWRADFVKSATAPSVMVTSGSQTIDYTRAVWKNTAVSIVGGESVDFTWQNGAWKPLAPMDIKTFGGKDGGDISAALAQAMLYTKKIYIPKGNYLASNVQLKSGIEIYGDGDSTVIQSLDTTTTKILYANSSDTNIVNNVKDITIRNIKFLGRVAAAGFSEHKHLVSLNGVTNVNISDVSFVGFRGDGLYVGTGVIGGEHRHNKDVTVTNCYFDGVNKDNRNAISFVDIDGATIKNSNFIRSSRVGMPGAIDFEPDYGYSHIKNVVIEGLNFEDCGGFQLIGFHNPTVTVDTIKNISIRNCTAKNNTAYYDIYANLFFTLSPTSASQNFVIDNWNGKNNKHPFYFKNTVGVSVLNSHYEDYGYDGVIGYETSSCYKTKIENTYFTRVGTQSTILGGDFSEFYINFGAITLYSASDVSIDATFSDCGNGNTYKCGVYFASGITDNIDLKLKMIGTYDYSVFKSGNNTNTDKNVKIKVNEGYLHNVANFLSDDKGSVNNVFTDSESLDAFPVGRSSTIINGVTIGGYTQGVLITEKYTNYSSYTNWGVQYFIPRSINGGNDTTDIFIRKSKNDASSWYDWAKIGEKNSPTYRVKITANYTVLTSDRYISVENDSTNVTLTLPKASDFPKRLLTIKRLNKAGGSLSTGSITLTPTTNTTAQAGNIENLDGTFGASTTLTAHGAYGSTITLLSNGAEWERINN